MHVETSSAICSVSLSQNEQHLETIEGSYANSHATQLTPFIEAVCKNQGLSCEDLFALSFSAGPGSYTGLRIGLSTLKGISFLLNKPIVFINTLDAIASAMIAEFDGKDYLYCPIIDAKRREVYTSTYNNKGERLSEYKSLFLAENDEFKKIYNKNNIILGGDGTKYTQNSLYYNDITHSSILKPSSKFLISNAILKILKEDFENKSFCEPFYLKNPFLNIKKQ